MSTTHVPASAPTAAHAAAHAPGDCPDRPAPITVEWRCPSCGARWLEWPLRGRPRDFYGFPIPAQPTYQV